MRMADPSGSPRLTPKALTCGVVRQRLGANHFDGHGSIEPVVVRGINHAHSAFAEHTRNSITAYSFHADRPSVTRAVVRSVDPYNLPALI